MFQVFRQISILGLLLGLVSFSQTPTQHTELPKCSERQVDYRDNCIGTLTYAGTGNDWDGEFHEGFAKGHGTFTYASGKKWVGEFRDNLPNGHGILTFAEGDKYVGEVREDKFSGQGTYTWSNGDKYVGEFRDDERNGQGTLTFAKRADVLWRIPYRQAYWPGNLHRCQRKKVRRRIP